MMSAFSARAVSRIFAAGTMTPRSTHLVIVALEHDADDVLADVVHVALHRRHHDLAVGAALGRTACEPALSFSFSMNGIR